MVKQIFPCNALNHLCYLFHKSFLTCSLLFHSMTDCRKFLLPGGDVHPQEKGQQELHDPVEATPRKPTSTPTIRQQAPPQALTFLWVPLTWGTSSTHFPSCFLATLVPNSLEKKKKREKVVLKSQQATLVISEWVTCRAYMLWAHSAQSLL